MSTIQRGVEVIATTSASVDIARACGASRIELCSVLQIGGVSPNVGLVNYAVKNAGIPVFAMIRPREGHFIYSNNECTWMLDEIEALQEMGIDGIVIGALNKDLSVNANFLKAARDRWKKHITFHRAIDLVQNPFDVLELVIDHGAQCILTSGGALTAIEGKEVIFKMADQAGDRIQIMPGSGLNGANVSQLKHPNIHIYHGSVKHNVGPKTEGGIYDTQHVEIDPDALTAFVHAVNAL